MCHRLLHLLDDLKIYWVERMARRLGIFWLLTSRTAHGAEKIADDLQVTLDFWSSRVPPQKMEGFVTHDGDSAAAPLLAVLQNLRGRYQAGVS